MKALWKKNKLIRDNFKKTELNSYIYSALIKNNLLGPAIKDNLNTLLSQMGDGLSENKKNIVELPKVSKIRNICVITGRTRAVVQKYKMSRIQFKQNAEAGLIPGIKKL
jgi:small subunit ribosomal protein S14